MLKKVLKFITIVIVNFGLLYAKGTLANTIIKNVAYMEYTYDENDINYSSNINSFVVDKVVDIVLMWQNNAPVEVSPSEKNRVLKFELLNLGNFTDDINLSYEHNSTSDFMPLNPTIHIDSNNNGVYDQNIDIESNETNLTADGNVSLFIVANIPTNIDIHKTDLNKSYISRDDLMAISNSTQTVGKDSPNAVDTIIRQDNDIAEGVYRTIDYFLISTKSAIVHNDDNATHTGTLITYIIDIYIGGNAKDNKISNVKFRDTIPVGTKYKAGSLRLNDANLSDPADKDEGSFDGHNICVNVGTINGKIHKKVKFDVQVQ